MLKCTSGLNAHRLETIILLISAQPFRNVSVFACSTACSSAVIGVKMSEYGTVP